MKLIIVRFLRKHSFVYDVREISSQITLLFFYRRRRSIEISDVKYRQRTLNDNI